MAGMWAGAAAAPAGEHGKTFKKSVEQPRTLTSNTEKRVGTYTDRTQSILRCILYGFMCYAPRCRSPKDGRAGRAPRGCRPPGKSELNVIRNRTQQTPPLP